MYNSPIKKGGRPISGGHFNDNGYVYYKVAHFADEKDWSRYRDVETTQVFRAVKYCKESDEEYNKRVEQENELKEMRRKEYERLRGEFGGETEQ